MEIDVKEDLLSDPSRKNTASIEKELNDFFDHDEGQKIKSDIELLISMGFDKKMVKKVYILFSPDNIERAIDYMTEIDGIYQHDFIASSNPKENLLCFICKKPKQNHLDYIPENLLIGAQINNVPVNNPPIIDDISVEEEKKSDKKSDDLINECEVCYEELNNEEKDLNSMPCGHLFCTNCWFNYLKTSITEAKVEKIKCMEHGCNEIVSEDFIIKHIDENDDLIAKYKKFKKRAEIIKDKNKKICPNPDCESFLQKSSTSKYVECENGHKYCFDCLKPPHGNNSCDQTLEKQFLKWKKGKRVKRCPRCQMYTEKNEGCNHMTCISCKYQWCWLCEGEYRYDHYESGKCRGLQFTRADNLKCICFKSFGLHKIFKGVYPDISGYVPFDEVPLWLKYLAILGFWLFGFGVMEIFVFFCFIDEKLDVFDDDCNNCLVYFFTIMITLALFLCFQLFFAALISPFILISFVYHPFFEKLLYFFGIGE